MKCVERGLRRRDPLRTFPLKISGRRVWRVVRVSTGLAERVRGRLGHDRRRTGRYDIDGRPPREESCVVWWKMVGALVTLVAFGACSGSSDVRGSGTTGSTLSDGERVVAANSSGVSVDGPARQCVVDALNSDPKLAARLVSSGVRSGTDDYGVVQRLVADCGSRVTMAAGFVVAERRAHGRLSASAEDCLRVGYLRLSKQDRERVESEGVSRERSDAVRALEEECGS